ncbi:aldo/keto reductase [Lachnospiraceae bacterium 45-W7]
MQYRRLPQDGTEISIIGMGTSCLHHTDADEIEKTICLAIENGINYFDTVVTKAREFEAMANVFAKNRDKVYLQQHFGAMYPGDGKYGWTRDLSVIKDTFQRQLRLLGTDYTDFGFVHCIDEKEDFENVMKNGLWDYMKGLKNGGIIRHLGCSTHNPEILRRFLDTGLIDMAMFSINPAYDYAVGKFEHALGDLQSRSRIYAECEAAGVGLSVMKVLGGGQLLDARSPFGQTLTKNQCIQYALDRPAVLTVLPGVTSRKTLKEILEYISAEESEKDYTIIENLHIKPEEARCVYCNHCQPCPKGIDIGMLNKYYDLALVGDRLAFGHYKKQEIKADACISCGHCEKQCPFHVKQMQRMHEIAAYFKES